MAGIDSYPVRRLGAGEVAGSVGWLVGTGRAGGGGGGGKGGYGGGGGGPQQQQWAWMRDLYRLVFGFGVEEGERMMRGGGAGTGGGGMVQV